MTEKVRSKYSPTSLVLNYSLRHIIFHATAIFYLVLSYSAGASRKLYIAITAAIILAAPKALKAIYLLMKNGTVEGCLKQVGWAVLESLHNCGEIKTNSKQFKVRTALDKKSGHMFVSLLGGDHYEKSIFLNSMEEVLSPIEKPKFILVRKSNFSLFNQIDYHAVPMALSRSKEDAEYFAEKWQRYICPCAIYNTRKIDGRQQLLKARANAMTSTFAKKSKRLSVWE